MDEATTKEELRPVKKQLVSTTILKAIHSLMFVTETTQTVGRGYAPR
jgi:hypothetical protein